VCFEDTCRFAEIYSGEKIKADAWLFGESAQAGIIGLGVESPFWNAFINPGTLKATYSIALAE
jgi:hypothetical protein